ncbi:ferredoxin [filamentous cyanobacterium LEGE 11480]|uniref:Ferredoxin n=1 Tax=Romeriopsis navalis LEGE 11480 TaxID=2777977 RepID=A0A928VLJ9_9CYAN|nr:ferredoxin [Romeriopsis navalis]MBE9030555.1 ferredoxin [Romeriopsis navalis LEGE 11480]
MSGDDPQQSNSAGQVPANDAERSGFEPELGGFLRESEDGRSGFEPELGGVVRQKGVYVDEATCIGCQYCSHVARSTFYIEPDYGRSRVISQDSDSEDLIQEAIDTCPVDCIHWVNYAELAELEEERKYQVLKPVGFPVERQVTYRKKPRKVRKRNPS